MRASASLLLVVALLNQAPVAGARPPRTTTGHHYTLKARLEARKHRVVGEARIQWRNNSDKPTSLLFLHLYANAFKDNQTAFIREGGASIRGQSLRDKGWIKVTKLATADGVDLLPVTTAKGFVQGDTTQLQVTLPSPVAAGEDLELLVDFATTLPRVVARMGHAGKFHMVAQWFPKLAKHNPDGGWVTFPYHGLGEFHADFADYDLTLDVPASYVVAAPGRQVEKSSKKGRRIERYVLDNVHDIAWAAYPHLERHSFEQDDKTITFMAPRGYRAAVERQWHVVSAGLRRFEKAYGTYPYERLMVIIPPSGAWGAAGMEYPTMFTSAGAWFASPWLSLPDPLNDVVAAHELAHQWFCGMVATNEVEHPVLDEGLTEWASLDLLQDMARRERLSFPVGTFDVHREWFQSLAHVPSSLKPASAYLADQLAGAIYIRPALALETIARTWGRPRLHEALGAYARQHRFRHPGPADLYAAFDDVYWAGFSDSVLRPALEGRSFDAEISSFSSSQKAGTFSAAVTVRRTGPGALPSWVLFENADGERQRHPWPAGLKELSLSVQDSTSIVGVAIDPDHANLLDGDYSDNQRTLAGTRRQGALFAWLTYAAQAFASVIGP